MPTSRRSLHKVSVFIASPGDVTTARDAVRHAVDRINRLVAKPNGVLLEAIGWEDVPAGRGQRAQEVINPFVDGADIFVGLLARRFGTPTGVAESGTLEEYQRAVARWNSASPTPDIKVYFRQLTPSELLEPSEALQRVLNFRQGIAPTDLYHEFTDDDDLEQRVENDLAAWIYARVESGTLPPMSSLHGISGSDVNSLAAILTGSIDDVSRDTIHELIKAGLVRVAGASHSLANSTDGFVAVAKHLNAPRHRREFLQSSYFSEMMRMHLKSVIQLRYHIEVTEEDVDVLRRIAILSPAVTSYLLGGDTSLYDNLFEHSMKTGIHAYATDMRHQNLLHQALVAYATDAINGVLLDTVDGTPLAGQVVEVSIRAAFEDRGSLELTSLVPSIRARFGGPGVADKGQMVFATDPGFFVRNGTVLLQLRLFEQAASEFRLALNMELTSEGRAVALNNLGLSLLNTGKKEEARQLFAEAAELNPQSVEIKNNIALVGDTATT